ncbi:MAG: hypothetical protein RL685_1501 [Pseudomonadota bacterium]
MCGRAGGAAFGAFDTTDRNLTADIEAESVWEEERLDCGRGEAPSECVRRAPKRRFIRSSISRSSARDTMSDKSPPGYAWRRRSRACCSLCWRLASAVNWTRYRPVDKGSIHWERLLRGESPTIFERVGARCDCCGPRCIAPGAAAAAPTGAVVGGDGGWAGRSASARSGSLRICAATSGLGKRAASSSRVCCSDAPRIAGISSSWFSAESTGLSSSATDRPMRPLASSGNSDGNRRARRANSMRRQASSSLMPRRCTQ